MLDHGLKKLLFLQDVFYQDRPLMWLFNRNVAAMLRFIQGETMELIVANGHGYEGMSRDLYREQELADIGWFALGTLKVIRGDVNLPPVDVHIDTTGKSRETEYKRLRDEIWYLASRFPNLTKTESVNVADISEHDKNAVIQTMNHILARLWKIYEIMSIDPVAALANKMGRNMSKYPANYFDLPAGLTLSDAAKLYEAKRKEAALEWQSINGNRQFYETHEYTPQSPYEQVNQWPIVPAPRGDARANIGALR